ncbi:hypothetical protein Tco_1165094 [Tanacetum coccineum]
MKKWLKDLLKELGQTTMKSDYELAQRLQAEEQGELTIKETSRLFVELMDKRKKHFAKLRGGGRQWKKNESSRKEIISKKRAGEELDEESVKRQKLEDDAEKAELQLCLEIVPRDDEAVNVESLSTKYPIVDWKTHILAEDKMYYQIIRADGSEKYYKIFSAMLDDFDRQDVLDLYMLVKERFKTASPEGYDRLL